MSLRKRTVISPWYLGCLKAECQYAVDKGTRTVSGTCVVIFEPTDERHNGEIDHLSVPVTVNLDAYNKDEMDIFVFRAAIHSALDNLPEFKKRVKMWVKRQHD